MEQEGQVCEPRFLSVSPSDKIEMLRTTSQPDFMANPWPSDLVSALSLKEKKFLLNTTRRITTSGQALPAFISAHIYFTFLESHLSFHSCTVRRGNWRSFLPPGTLLLQPLYHKLSFATVSDDQDRTCWDTPWSQKLANCTPGNLAEVSKEWEFSRKFVFTLWKSAYVAESYSRLHLFSEQRLFLLWPFLKSDFCPLERNSALQWCFPARPFHLWEASWEEFWQVF